MKKNNKFYGLGRRKTAIARVLLEKGEGKLTINGKDQNIEDAFAPFKVVGLEGKFNIDAKIMGGGVSSQIGALRLGVARALVNFDEKLKPVLRKNGFLTRDPRIKERKKPGLRRARRAPQWQKR